MPPIRSVYSVGHETRSGRPRGFGRRLLVGELPQMDALTVIGDGSAPLAPVRCPANPSVFGGRVVVTGLVLPIAGQRDRSQVAATVIQSVPIDVVAFKTVAMGESQQLAVQADVLRAAIDPIAAFGVPLVIQRPSPPARPFDIGGIYDRIGKNGVTALERDQGGQSVFALANGSATPPATSARTIKSESLLDPCRSGKKVSVARAANARNDTLRGHRVTSGVSPRPLARRWGTLLPSNYTRYQIGGTL